MRLVPSSVAVDAGIAHRDDSFGCALGCEAGADATVSYLSVLAKAAALCQPADELLRFGVRGQEFAFRQMEVCLQCWDGPFYHKQGRKMSAARIIGIVLIIAGVLALAYQGISYTTREKVLDVGPIEATTEDRETIPIPPIIGVAALAGGIVLLLKKNKSAV